MISHWATAVGTTDSYLLGVSDVDSRWEDQNESAVVARYGPARWARVTAALPHENQGKTGYENHPTSSHPELEYGLVSRRARCG